jgi:uncharacterized cupredoxin-like copper-binding protein
MRRWFALAVMLLSGAVIVIPSVAAAGRHERSSSTAKTIKVTSGEYFFRLNAKTVRAGRVRFRLTNRGASGHDFKIAGRKTRVVRSGRSATISVRLRRGTYRYLCTRRGHARAGMSGVFRVR